MSAPRTSLWPAIAIAGLLGGLGLLLAWAFLTALLGYEGERLAEIALARVPDSGVSNPVTAVLLNFRAYDTLLELAVLLAALLGIWSLGPASLPYGAPEPVLARLVGWVVPLLVLSAGYLLWVGGHAPGGAFQAGALLGAAGVMLRLAGYASAGLPRRHLQPVLMAGGLLAFVAVGLIQTALGLGFLTYAPASAKWVILLIETAATLAIGATLAAAFVGGDPARVPRPASGGAPAP